MWLKYVDAGSGHLDVIRDHAANHKTTIILNGGDHKALENIVNLFKYPRNHFPWAYFTETGLNDALTSVTIILPGRLYDKESTAVGQSLLADGCDVFQYSGNWEHDLLRLRVSCPLAV